MKSRAIILILIGLLLTGCTSGTAAEKGTKNNPTIIVRSILRSEIRKRREASKTEENTEPETIENEKPAKNGRPVITYKYPVIVVETGRQYFGLFSVNVASVIDPEDGELPVDDTPTGFEFPTEAESEAFWVTLSTQDNPAVVEAFGSGFYFSMSHGNADEKTGLREIGTFAYDSQGQLSTKSYYLIYTPKCTDNSLPYATVLTEGLRARRKPSTSAEVLGHVWKGAEYTLYESINAEGYTWYRIGDDIWIADDGSWLQIHD